MIEYPSSANINGNMIFHEGNHDDRGNFHDQYVGKFSDIYIETRDTFANMFVKIANINLIMNSNIAWLYKIKIDEITMNNPHTIDILIRYINSLPVVTITNHGDNTLVVYGMDSTSQNSSGNTIYNLDLYIKPINIWKNYRVRTDTATAIRRDDLNYDDLYAYRHLTLLDNQTFVSSITATLNEIIDRPVIYTTASTPLTALPVNLEQDIVLSTSLTDTTKGWFTINPDVNIDGNISYNIVPYTGGEFFIKARNYAAYSVNLPAIKWSIAFKPSI